MTDEKIKRGTMFGRFWSQTERKRRERQEAVDAISQDHIELEKPTAHDSPFDVAVVRDR